MKNKIITDFKVGNIIRFGFHAEDLNSKLLKNKEPSFWTKHIQWYTIEVYSLQLNGKKYLKLNHVKRIFKFERALSWVLLVAGILGLGYTLTMYTYKEIS